MKRWLFAAVPLALVLAVWFLGRAPSRFVLEEACRSFHRERKEIDERFSLKAGTVSPQEYVDLKGNRTVLLSRSKRVRAGGWDVLLIPPGGIRPPMEGFLPAGAFDPSTEKDPPVLAGAMRIWLKPRGFFARCLADLGVSP